MPTPLAIDVIGPMDEHSGSGAMRQMLSNSPKPMFAVVVACQAPLRARGLALPVCPFGLGDEVVGDEGGARVRARVCVGVCVAGGGLAVEVGLVWVTGRCSDRGYQFVSTTAEGEEGSTAVVGGCGRGGS